MNTFYRLFFFAFIIISSSAEAATQWSIIQVTDNDFGDIDPVVNNSHVAWLGWVDNNWEVFAYDGNSITRLTNSTNIDEQHLFASDKYITWNSDDIFLYDGKAVTNLTNSYTHEYSPKIWGERMVWGKAINDVILYDITTGTSSQLVPPGGTGSENEPCIYGDSVSFTSSDGKSAEIYYYDIVQDEYHKITDNSLTDSESTINDHYIAYIHWDSNDREIMLYNRDTNITTQITNNTVNDSNLLLNGNHLVWTSGTGSYDYKLNLYDISSGTTQVIASNLRSADIPSIDGNIVVYPGYDGNDTEIYIYEIDSGTTTQLTDNDAYDTYPKVSGQRIVWMYDDLTTQPKPDKEIMLATPISKGMFYIINSSDGKTAVIHLR